MRWKAWTSSLESFLVGALAVDPPGAASARRNGLACRSCRGPRPRQTITKGSPGTWEVCRLLRYQESVRVSPNNKAPGPPEVRLLLGGAKDKARRGYREANAMSQRDGRQKSECPHSTSAAGEPSRGSPSRGRRAPCHRPLGRNTVRASNLISVSTEDQRIAKLVKQALCGIESQRVLLAQWVRGGSHVGPPGSEPVTGGAGCLNWARPDLSGGRSAMAVPTGKCAGKTGKE